MVAKFGDVEVVDLGEKSFKLVYRDFKEYPEFHYGAFDYGLRNELNFDCKVTLNVERFENDGKGDVLADFEIIFEWE